MIASEAAVAAPHHAAPIACARESYVSLEYGYINRLAEGRFALLEWTADCGAVAVHDGADSFVVENGKVIAQTIHYALSVRNPQALTGRSGS